MGTNYYVGMRKPSCEECGRGYDDERLHIGKQSFGWAFLFAPYPEHGLTSWAAWRTFLADKTIVDEYGRVTTLDELAATVEATKGRWSAVTAPEHVWGPHRRDHESGDAEGYRFSDRADFS